MTNSNTEPTDTPLASLENLPTSTYVTFASLGVPPPTSSGIKSPAEEILFSAWQKLFSKLEALVASDRSSSDGASSSSPSGSSSASTEQISIDENISTNESSREEQVRRRNTPPFWPTGEKLDRILNE